MEQRTTPPLEPPNGHDVSTGELYAALFHMDQRLGERDTAFMNQLQGLRNDFEGHRKDGHPYAGQAEIVKQEIALDAKKVGLAGAALAVLGTVLGLLRSKFGL